MRLAAAALLVGLVANPLEAQDRPEGAAVGAGAAAFVFTPSLAYAAHRDERASPLRYSGLLWGLGVVYTSSTTGTGWHVGAEVARGTVDRGGRASPTESSTSGGLRGGYVRALSGAPGWRLGVEGTVTGGVRVHRSGGADAGYAEVLLGVGPSVDYEHEVGEGGSLGVHATGTLAAVMARPYSNVGLARTRDLVVRARLAPGLLVARAGIRYAPWPPGRIGLAFGYDLTMERIRDDDRYGRIVHALACELTWRRGS
jgi:hypothetical protein